MGLPGMRRSNKKSARGKKGKKGRSAGRGPTAAKLPAGFPGALGPGGFGGADFPAALDQLPPGMQMPDLSKLNLPKK
jgi:signal recognition particle subunit SRP54